MIGARFYSQIDAMQLQCDILENKMRKETINGRLLKLVVKLACINEWPGLVILFFFLNLIVDYVKGVEST